MKQTDWTREQKLQLLMRLPWRVQIERDATDGSYIGQVAEVPDAIGEGESEREVAADLWESLSASLAVRLDNGDALPLPPNTRLPWDAGLPPTLRVRAQRATMTKGDAGWSNSGIDFIGGGTFSGTLTK